MRISSALVSATAAVFVLGPAPTHGAEESPKCVSICSADLDGDGNLDLALLIETGKRRELVVLLATASAYRAFVLKRDAEGMDLSCRRGATLKATAAGGEDSRRKVHQTPGSYLQLRQPEGAAVAFYWNGKTFTEVWTAD
jgi:hypothetical protein